MGTNKRREIERRQQRKARTTERGELFGRDRQERAARVVASGLGWGFAGTDKATGAFIVVLPEIR